jgi:uncharacterized protein (DUF302 family)/uncharacterized membrane protein YidH (DUF202 family)
MPDRTAAGPNEYMAAERTMLAWIRTGLALMGFGFVVARFGLFLQALQTGHAASIQTRPYGLSFWFGTGLILIGVAVNLVAARNHIDLIRQLDRGESGFRRPSALAIAVAVMLSLLGLAMAIYLISVRDPKEPVASAIHVTGEKMMNSNAENGIVTIPSRHSVDETVETFKKILDAKDVKLFTIVDHSGEAEKAGLQMQPTKLLIFGNPKAGTPLMVAAPSAAIDLPLKALVWEDAEGKVWISYNSPSYLQTRHHLPEDLVQSSIGNAAGALAAKAAE